METQELKEEWGPHVSFYCCRPSSILFENLTFTVTVQNAQLLLTYFIAGTLQKPILWAEPSSVINIGKPMTIWCKGTTKTQVYFLHKVGSPAPWEGQPFHRPDTKAMFSITSVERHHAGQYHCYCYKSVGWSEHSDTLELVVTGEKTHPTPKTCFEKRDMFTLGSISQTPEEGQMYTSMSPLNKLPLLT